MSWFFASLPLLIITIVSWMLTGLVIVRRVFGLTDGMTVFCLALPIGLVIQIIIVNALARLIFFPITTWVVVVGMLPLCLYCLRRPLPELTWKISVRTRLGLLAVFVTITLIVFYTDIRMVYTDDTAHMTMTQMMASGIFPLQLNCNPDFRRSYDYGGDLLAAMLEIMSGTASWNAVDVIKIIETVSVVLLAFLVGWRYKNKVGAGLTSVFLLFTAGTMLWIFLPFDSAGGRYLADQKSLTSQLPAQLDKMISSVGDYSMRPPGWITATFAHMQLTPSWTFAPFIILLLLVIMDLAITKPIKTIAVGVVVGMSSLLQPAVLMIFLPGVIGYILLWLVSERFKRGTLQFAPPTFNPYLALAIASVLLVVQGGMVTDSLLDKLNGIANASTSFAISLINLPSCRGQSPTLNCAMLTVGNIGLTPLLIPFLFWFAWRIMRNSGWMMLLIGSVVAMGITLFVTYGELDWNILRVFAFATWTAAVMIGPILYEYFIRRGWINKIVIGGVLVMISYSGIVTAVTTISGRGIPDVFSDDFSPPVDPLELGLIKYGSLLPLNARFFDPTGCLTQSGDRPGYLFGRYMISSLSLGKWQTGTPTFNQLVKTPSADLLYSGGYTHLFIDSDWYKTLTPNAVETLRADPLDVIAWSGTPDNFRVLLRVCARDEGCLPYVPGVMESLNPIKLNFGDAIQLTGFRRSVGMDNKVHIGFSFIALRPLTSDYRFSLRLASSDGKTYQMDGKPDIPASQWTVGWPYTERDLTFYDIPPGKYQLSIRWYDANTPDMHALTTTDTSKNIVADAVLSSTFNVVFPNPGALN